MNSITYYPQGKGQSESTNNLLGTLLTNLVSENITNWDEHLSIVLFSYKTAYKVATRYTPYQFMYGLHPLMPIKYIMPIVSGNYRDNILVRILSRNFSKLKKLQDAKMQDIETISIQHWNITLWSQQKIPKKQFTFVDYVMWFPKRNKLHLRKLLRNGLDHTK